MQGQVAPGGRGLRGFCFKSRRKPQRLGNRWMNDVTRSSWLPGIPPGRGRGPWGLSREAVVKLEMTVAEEVGEGVEMRGSFRG